MTFTTTLRNGLIAAATLAVSAVTLSVTGAQAKGYHVQRNAITYNFPSYDSLNVRAWPASSSRIKFDVPRGQGVYVQRCIIKTGTDWCKIRAYGRSGWVNGSFIKSVGRNYASPHPYAYGWH